MSTLVGVFNGPPTGLRGGCQQARRADSVWLPAVHCGVRGVFVELLPEPNGEPDVEEQSSVEYAEGIMVS